MRKTRGAIEEPRAKRTSSPADIAAAIGRDLKRLPVMTTPSVRSVLRRYTKGLAHDPPETVVAVAKGLLGGGAWPERVIAFELVASRPDARRQLRAADYDGWAEGLADWGSIDLYAVTIAGLAWREGHVSDTQVMKWSRSTDRWRRRLALVATVPLNSRARGGSGDTHRTLNICRMLADDRDDMVVKALSWALRELSKRDPGSVARFVREEDGRLAARVRREVTSKLATGLKAPRPRRPKGP
ncbi:MAG TPA: DNA alkylation repair protein [Vicinamibacterales bacterium]|nr:DNA alkylation repair protein [Vicinamibacterales bacterium]